MGSNARPLCAGYLLKIKKKMSEVVVRVTYACQRLEFVLTRMTPLFSQVA